MRIRRFDIMFSSLIAVSALLLWPVSDCRSAEPEDFVITRSVFSSAGRAGSATGFRLSGSLGQTATGTGDAVGLWMHHGYWQDFRRVLCGDPTHDQFVDIDDVIFLISFVFLGGPAPNPEYIGDVNCFDWIDIDDVVYLINYVFLAGATPCADCP